MEGPKVPAIDQFITWCNAINSCFSVLRAVDKDTISDETATSKTYYKAAKVSLYIFSRSNHIRQSMMHHIDT